MRSSEPEVPAENAVTVLLHNVITPDDDLWLIKNRVGEVLENLVELGWDVTLVSKVGPRYGFLTHALSPRVKVVPLGRARGLRRRARELTSALGAVRGRQPVLVFMPSALCAITAIALGRRALVYSGASWKLWRYPPWRSVLEQLVAKRVHGVVAAGDELHAYFSQHARRVSRCVPHVPREVSERLRRPPSATAGPPHTPLRVLFVGGVIPRKGVLELIEAVAGLPAVELRIAGAVDGSSYSQQVISLVDTIDNVALCGYADWPKLRELYEWGDVLAAPSHGEGFPRVAYEATAFGLALVVTPVGGIPDRLNDGRDALYVPVGESGEIATALASLAEDPACVRQLAHNAHERLSAVFVDPSPAAQLARELTSLSRQSAGQAT